MRVIIAGSRSMTAAEEVTTAIAHSGFAHHGSDFGGYVRGRYAGRSLGKDAQDPHAMLSHAVGALWEERWVSPERSNGVRG